MLRFRQILVLTLSVALLLMLKLPPTYAQGSDKPLAPTGVPGETYYAPFPVNITLDGDLSDWKGVPQVKLVSDSGKAGVTFAAAADDQYLYFSGDVLDDHIVSGEHGTDYWNEDSVELYINGTGNFDLPGYVNGVVQIAVPPLNADKADNETIVGGVNGDMADAKVKVVLTKTGYNVEMAVSLHNDIWDIVPKHDGEIGFQVHLNATSAGDRDTKLIWSKFDTTDESYTNPRLFGKLIFFEVGHAVAAASTALPPTQTPIPVDNSITWDSREWKLLWSDEFEGKAGTPVDSANWVPDLGGDGWGNAELEYYTNSTDNAALDGNGNLAIVARKAEPDQFRCYYGPCQYTSARLTTKGKVEFTYGRVEARLRIPRGQGLWPAFWMLGADIDQVSWPASGEIDIMENVGFEPRVVHGTIHGPGYSGTSGRGFPYRMEQDVADDFHIFAIDWDPNVIRWYIDGKLAKTTTADSVSPHKWVYDHDFFIILNVAVGGRWPGIPNKDTVFPQTMLVDYVRVYQLAK